MRRIWYPVLFLILLCIIHVQLVAAITSNYQQEANLQFAYGPPSVLNAFSTADTGIQNTHFVALLGTLTVEIDGNHLFDPALVEMQLSSNLTIEGYVRPNSTSIQYNNQIPVDIRAVSVAKNKVIKSEIINGSNFTLGKNSGNVLGGSDTLYVYLVLVHTLSDLNYFIPGTIYKLTESSNVGSFVLEAREGGNTPVEDVPVSVNGDAPVPGIPAPFIGTGSGTTPDIPYEGDFDFTHYFNFTILSNPASFILGNATTGQRPTIATLQVQVFNALPGNEYGVNIAFSSKNQSGFTLHLDGDLSKHGIPYHLYLGTEEIFNNSISTWRQLFTQSNTLAVSTKDVSVSVSDLSAVSQALVGTYQDTVTVFIIPLDTL